ncbi:polymer-forming cytoskeletal protein [Candidatus Parcubacteria bacterium]|nr:polymer-forming cytoskeletal protein [Candidatus Parcubacteria bacterium]
MFNKNVKEVTQNEAETIIGPSIKVKGNFHGEGSMIIEGQVEGSIKTKNYLLAGSRSQITANISAKNAKISGKIKGNITINDYLEISSSAVINGDISTTQISIEKGAQINGNINTTKNEIVDSKIK